MEGGGGFQLVLGELDPCSVFALDSSCQAANVGKPISQLAQPIKKFCDNGEVQNIAR